MADERATPLNQGVDKWLQITDGGKLQTWNGVDIPTPIIGDDPLVTKTELDDKASLSMFEQGEFTPYYTTSGTNFDSITHDIQSGHYITINDFVIIRLSLGTSSVTIGSASGRLQIEGLPFSGSGSFIAGAFYAVGASDTINPRSRIVGDAIEFYESTIADGLFSNTLDANQIGTGSGANRIINAIGIMQR